MESMQFKYLISAGSKLGEPLRGAKQLYIDALIQDPGTMTLSKATKIKEAEDKIRRENELKRKKRFEKLDKFLELFGLRRINA